MTNSRNNAREGELVDKKFRLLYTPFVSEIESFEFDNKTGKLIVPQELQREVEVKNHEWNYQATIFNKKLKEATANFNAVKTLFKKDLQSRELKLFAQSVAKIMEDKFSLSAKDIEVEFIMLNKANGLNPEETCDKRFMEIEPKKVHLLKHKHEFIVIPSEKEFVIVCKTCNHKFKTKFQTPTEAFRVSRKLPKTKLGLLTYYFTLKKTKDVKQD